MTVPASRARTVGPVWMPLGRTGVVVLLALPASTVRQVSHCSQTTQYMYLSRSDWKRFFDMFFLKISVKFTALYSNVLVLKAAGILQ